jgi:hypothetical protein
MILSAEDVLLCGCIPEQGDQFSAGHIGKRLAGNVWHRLGNDRHLGFRKRLQLRRPLHVGSENASPLNRCEMLSNSGHIISQNVIAHVLSFIWRIMAAGSFEFLPQPANVCGSGLGACHRKLLPHERGELWRRRAISQVFCGAKHVVYQRIAATRANPQQIQPKTPEQCVSVFNVVAHESACRRKLFFARGFGRVAKR